MSHNRWRFSKPIIAVGVFGLAVGLLAGLTALIAGKPGTGRGLGLVDDWTHHHVVFSNPGTFAQAVAQGRFKQWYRTVSDPRYIMQQMKRKSALIGSAANAQDFATLSTRLAMPVTDPSLSIFRGPRKPPPKQAPDSQRDWAFSLGSGTVPQGMYPAKFTLDINATPDCTHDFVVYGLNVAGVTFGQANLVGLNNLYSSSGGAAYCGGTGPDVYWAYNTSFAGGKVTTSPVLSLDGTKAIFVESGGTTGPYLHVLVWSAGEGTVSDSSGIDDKLSAGLGVGSCSSTEPSCLVSILLNTTTETVTHSMPFYDYWDDIVYVGDDAGNLYKVTPVLGSGTPAVTKLSVASGSILTGPVYDPTSALVFVGASSGYLYSVSTAGTFGSTVVKSYQVAVSSGIVDAPLVDPVAEQVYVFVGEDINGSTSSSPCNPGHTAACNGVFQFPAKFTATQSLSESVTGVGTTNVIYAGAFDNIYYTSTSHTSPSGNLYVCGANGSNYPKLSELGISSDAFTGTASQSITNGTSVNATNIINPMTGAAATCSPVTEIYNGTTDLIFLSVSGSGTVPITSGGSACTGPCAYSFNTTSALTSSSTAANGFLTVAGGTSGIVIDNVYVSPAWVASHNYSDGNLITDSNGNVEEVNVCSGECTSGSTAPAWTKGVLTTLSAAITTTTATSVSVTSATGFVTNDYIFVGGEEYMKITGVSSNTLTVTRGQLGSTAETWSSGASVRGATDDDEVVWNNLGPTQTSSLYFTTLATGTCNGTSSVYCAIKLTQAGFE